MLYVFSFVRGLYSDSSLFLGGKRISVFLFGKKRGHHTLTIVVTCIVPAHWAVALG